MALWAADMLRRFVLYRPPRSGEDPAANRMRERIGGVLLFTLGAAMTILGWVDRVPVRAAVEFPPFAVFGIALLLIPGYRTERRARGEDVEALSGTALITPRWWIVLALALGAGGINAGLLWLAGKL
jgi:hypothetical protein